MVKNENSINSSVNTNLERFQTLPSDGGNTPKQLMKDAVKDTSKDGITRDFYAIWDVDLKPIFLIPTTDIENTLGAFKFTSEGIFSIQKIDEKKKLFDYLEK